LNREKEGSEHRVLSRLFHSLIVAGTKEWYMERKDGVQKKDEKIGTRGAVTKSIKVKKTQAVHNFAQETAHYQRT
jgi:hypothetical protein